MLTMAARIGAALSAVVIMFTALFVLAANRKAIGWGIPIITVAATHASKAGAGAAISSGAAAGAAATGAGIGFVAGAAVWCGLNQPKRNWRRDTWVDGRADVYPSYKPREDGCIWRKKKHRRRGDPIAVRW